MGGKGMGVSVSEMGGWGNGGIRKGEKKNAMGDMGKVGNGDTKGRGGGR